MTSGTGEGVEDPVVTIDGPAGSGKSTTARAVARRLGLLHLDSGALYRAMTFALLDRDVPPDHWKDLSVEDLQRIPLEIRGGSMGFHVVYDGRDLGEELRTDEVTGHVSTASALPAVRERLLDLQRSAAGAGGLVADGRDMGTVVFPDADVKVFLTADLEERARRRLLERSPGEPPGGDEIRAEARRISDRDRRDTEREISPLRRPDGAVVLDTTERTFEEQVEAIVKHVKRAASRP